MKSPYLVCYDISDDKRLRQVFKLLKGIGIHLQYSVFYCSFTYPELKDFKMKISQLINKKDDDVRIYPLPKNNLVEVIGCGDRVPKNIDIYL